MIIEVFYVLGIFCLISQVFTQQQISIFSSCPGQVITLQDTGEPYCVNDEGCTGDMVQDTCNNLECSSCSQNPQAAQFCQNATNNGKNFWYCDDQSCMDYLGGVMAVNADGSDICLGYACQGWGCVNTTCPSEAIFGFAGFPVWNCLDPGSTPDNSDCPVMLRKGISEWECAVYSSNIPNSGSLLKIILIVVAGVLGVGVLILSLLLYRLHKRNKQRSLSEPIASSSFVIYKR